jgi:hypothetical protein
MKRLLVFAWLCAGATMVEDRAHAQEAHETPTEPEYSFDGPLLRITRPDLIRVIDLGCEGRSALRQGAKLFVACGPAGVVEINLSDPAAPRRAGTMRVDGDATSLFLRDGRVWVEVAHVDARPVSIDTPRAVTAAQAPLPQRDVALPSEGLAPLPPPRPPPQASPTKPQANIRTESGDLSQSETRNETPSKETPSLVAPPRRGDLWELSFLTGAFLALGSTLGGGTLGSASVTYRFGAPIVLRASLSPFGIAGPSPSSGGGAITTFGAHVLVGLDTQFVEVGLGVGGATVNQNTNQNFSNPIVTPDTGGVTIVEAARIGAHDGLALNFETSAISANGQFNLGYFVSSVQIPVSRTAMLVIRGGGGVVGFAYGDIGVRVLVAGDGGKGTIALTGFAGGAAIMVDLCSTNPDPPNATSCNNGTLAGPSLGGGIEWRP